MNNDQTPKEMAKDCLSLSHKYHDLLGCVQAQRPALLKDPELWLLARGLELTMKQFNQRVIEIAGQEDA